MMKRLLVLLAMLSYSTLAYALTIFDDDLEYASQGAFESVWASSCPGSSSIMGPSTAFSVSPTHSLRAVQDGGLNSCFVDKEFTGTTHLFYRWYMQYAPGYDFLSPCDPNGSCPGGSGGGKIMYAKALPANYDVFYFLEPDTREIRLSVPHGGYFVMCPSGPGMPFGTQPNEECVFRPNMATVALDAGATYCIETELIRSSPGVSDGTARIWINGTLTLEYTNVAMANTDEGSSAFNDIVYYSQGGYGTRYIDNLGVGTTRFNDCAGGGGGIDNTYPTGTRKFSPLSHIRRN